MGSSQFSVLIVTPIDYERTWNNREHNMARQFAMKGCRVTVLCKAMNRSSRAADLFRDTLTFRTQESSMHGVRVLRVDPFFNYYAGLRSHALAATNSSRPRPGIRNILVWLFFPLRFLRDLMFLPCFLYVALARIRERQDACVGFGPWGSLAGLWLRRLGRVRALVYEDRDFEPGLVPDGLRRRYTAFLERSLVRKADLAVSIGCKLAELRRSQSERDVHVVPTGIDWGRFAPARAMARRGGVMVYTGTLVSWSGLDLVIQALPAVIRECPSARLVVVGDGGDPYKEELRRLVQSLSLEDRVTFLGSVPNRTLPFILGEADIGLAVSEPVLYRKFACPLKVLEYMASGLAVIGTSDTETADMIDRYGCGISIPYDRDAFASAAIKLLRDPGSAARYRENGIRHSKDMDWETMMGRELELIRSLRRDATGEDMETRTSVAT